LFCFSECNDYEFRLLRTSLFFNRKNPPLLKIDIEGGESALFDTEDSWLSRVNVFVIEFHEYLKEGATQAILTKIFSTGQYRVWTQGEYMVIERLKWI